MAFAAYLLENAMLVLARGGASAHFSYASPWGFWMNRPAPPLGICSFSKKKIKKDKCRGEEGLGRLELPESLLTKQKVKMAGYWPSSSVRFY